MMGIVHPQLGVTEGVLADDNNIGTILTLLQGANRIAVDTETSGLDVRNKRDYLMGVCVYTPDVAAYVPFRHKSKNVSRRYFPYLWSILTACPELNWHHLKFDMHSFMTMGVNPLDLKGKQYDTLLMASLQNEERYSKQLDYLGKQILKIGKHEGDTIKKMGQIFGYANFDPEVYKTYGPQDSWITWKLKDYFEPKLIAEKTDKVYWETELPFNNLLWKMEQRAVGVNVPFCEEKTEIGNGRMATLIRALNFDPASSKQLGKYLLEEMGLPVLYHTDKCQACKDGHPVDSHTGNPSFNKVAMADYDDILKLQDNTNAKRVLEFRGWQKAVTSLYMPAVEKRGPDGLLRTQFNQARTVTGRLSSSDPNLQQVPRGSNNTWNGNAKSSFTSGRDEEFGLFGWDYAQLELRLAASYGREKLLLAEFEKDDADPFSVLAPQVFGILTPDTRYWTKNRLVYPSLYGAGLGKIALGLGKSKGEAAPIYEKYKKSISGITATSDQVIELVKQRGWVRYWDGRVRHIRDRSKVHTRAWNSVLQGGASQLVKKAMLRIEEFEDENCFMVLQVHDEITFCIRRSMIDYYEPLIKMAMTDFPIGVRLTVEGKEWK